MKYCKREMEQIGTFVSDEGIVNRIGFTNEDMQQFKVDRPAILMIVANHNHFFVARLVEPSYDV